MTIACNQELRTSNRFLISQLPAGGVNVLAPAAPDVGLHAPVGQVLVEGRDFIGLRVLVSRVFDGVILNEVNLAGQPLADDV